nr:MAG TPA: hypothetical protein [Caudoviricetes sp.]
MRKRGIVRASGCLLRMRKRDRRLAIRVPTQKKAGKSLRESCSSDFVKCQVSNSGLDSLPRA